MSESHFYLTEYKQKQFPVFQSHPTKKTILKAFKEWPKVMKSVTEYLLPEQYYNNKTFKPGMDVYRALLDEQGPFLKQYYFNIPLTLTGEPYTYDVIHSCGGEVIRKMQVTKNQIDSILGIKTISPYYQSAESLKLLEQFCECYDSPLFISKISNDRIGYKTTIINQGEYKDKIKTLPKREEEIYQKFIIPYQFKANIIRLHLYTLRSKKQTLTNAIKILNKTPMYDPATRSINSLMFCVNFNKQDSFDTVELIGKPLKSYIDMTQSLVGYIEDYAGICVTEVVADYIMDYHKVPWFLSFKSIKSSTKMIKDVKLTAEELQQLSLSTICKLCGLYFMKEEVTKMVTYKLIYGFLNHIKSRGVDPGLIQPKSNPNLQCKICSTCYNMIMKEIELYKLSTELARMQNTIEGIDDITDIGVSGGSTRREGEVGRKTQQYRWRLMINSNGLKNVEELNEYKRNDLELQFKIFGMKMKIPLWKSEAKTPGVNTPYEFSIGEQCGQFSSSSHYLMSKSIGKQSTGLNLQSKSYSPYQPPSPSIQLSYLKTLYFFSKHPDITQLLKDQQILLRITINKDWNNWVCQGNSRILGYLTNATELGQIYGTEVYMFFKDMKYLKMGLSLGLACDGVQEVPGNEKVKYKQIEIVKGGYYLCQPLPINWLELFDQL